MGFIYALRSEQEKTKHTSFWAIHFCVVTIRINQKKEYDLELPVHQKIKDLMQDISDSLEGLDPLSWFDPEKVSFMDKRTGRRLNPENSLLEECVWNGDILEIQGYK